MLDQIFIQILNLSYTASFVIVVVLLARQVFRRLPKAFSYALWSVVLFRLVCPFSVKSFFSLLPTNTNPISTDIVYMDVPKVHTGVAAINNAINSVLPPATPNASVNPLQVWIMIGGLVWLLGIVILLVYNLVGLLRLQHQLQHAMPYKNNIYVSDAIDTAFVLGVIRPKIYLPSHLSEAEQNYILLHEQTHIQRMDHIGRLSSFLVLCMHWFNPLVWLAFFLSGNDMEMACDEAVIQSLGNNFKKEYSTSLLTIATGRRMAFGAIAFGEGDTKSRIKNVLHYRKPSFWLVWIAIATIACVIVGLVTNPKKEAINVAGVNAVILEINKENQTMVVMGIDKNSVIGDRCVITWEGSPFITIATNSAPMNLSLDDFAIGDAIVLFIGEVQESYPTRAKATTIQLQPKDIPVKEYSAENLWNARTMYIGNNSAIGKLIGLLPVPVGLQYDHFKLHTAKQPYVIEIVYAMPTELLGQYDIENGSVMKPFRMNALLLLALVENADGVRVVLTDGDLEVGFTYDRDWADSTVGCDVRDYATSSKIVQELIDLLPSYPWFDEQINI